MPQQHQFRVFGLQFGRNRVEVGVRTVQQDDVGLYLVDNLLEIMIIGDGDILCRYSQGWCDAIHLNAVDVIDTRDAVFAEADDDISGSLSVLLLYIW